MQWAWTCWNRTADRNRAGNCVATQGIRSHRTALPIGTAEHTPERYRCAFWLLLRSSPTRWRNTQKIRNTQKCVLFLHSCQGHWIPCVFRRIDRDVVASSSPWHAAGLVATPFVDSLRSSWIVVASTLHRSRFNKTLVNHCCLHECRAWEFKKQYTEFLCVDPSTPRHHVDRDKMTNL